MRARMTIYGPSHPDYPNAPSDWDGGPYLCRDGGFYHMRGYGWAHGLGCWNSQADWDRVAYVAQGMEAGTGEPRFACLDPKDDSPVLEEDAPNTSPERRTP